MQESLPDSLPVAERLRRSDQGGGTAADSTFAAPERRIRALVIADSCNPEWESVPLQGWLHFAALRELVDTHLVTRSRNREALVRQGMVEGRDFTCFDTEALFDPAEALVRKIAGPHKGMGILNGLSVPSYVAFELLAWRRHAAALKAGTFDVVHRIMPMSPVFPSPIASRCRRLGIPFVLGPLNGGLAWPKQFPDLRRREGERFGFLRALHRLVPFYRATRRNAAAIVVAGEHAWTDVPRRWHDKLVQMLELGIDPARFPRPATRTADGYRGRPLRAVFLGRFVPYKGADMVIEAAAPLLRDGRMTLDIIGHGPEQERLEAMIAEHGVAGAATFAGKLQHRQIAERLARADVMAFPSVRELGGAAVLEAMAAGVVPIVVKYGGPGDLVTEDCGFLLPLAERGVIVAALRRVLERITAEPEQLAAMSAAGVTRAFAEFSWPEKARQMVEVYRWVLGRRADRPASPARMQHGE
jgi:glycosyltransferase involved in cell wall biosynthesis